MRVRVRGLLLMTALLLAGGTCQGQPRPTATATATPADCSPPLAPLPGLRVERLPGPTGCVTFVRIDPRQFRLRLLTAAEHGGSRTIVDWAHEFNLLGVINASMFAPDLKSIGVLVSGEVINRDKDNPQLGAFLAFDPIDPAAPPVVLTGRDCPNFDLSALRRRYRSVVQNYRLLDCAGNPIPWKDPHHFSAAAVGIDSNDQLVFIHVADWTQMTDFARFLSGQQLRAAMYVEGGPPAGLYLHTGATEVWETGFGLLGGRWTPIPNVLGIAPKEAP